MKQSTSQANLDATDCAVGLDELSDGSASVSDAPFNLLVGDFSALAIGGQQHVAGRACVGVGNLKWNGETFGINIIDAKDGPNAVIGLGLE